jgi:hypothetical protein
VVTSALTTHAAAMLFVIVVTSALTTHAAARALPAGAQQAASVGISTNNNDAIDTGATGYEVVVALARPAEAAAVLGGGKIKSRPFVWKQ